MDINQPHLWQVAWQEAEKCDCVAEFWQNNVILVAPSWLVSSLGNPIPNQQFLSCWPQHKYLFPTTFDLTWELSTEFLCHKRSDLKLLFFWGGRKVINICWLHFKFHSGKVGRRTSWWSDINLSFDQEEERHRQPPYSCSWMPQSASLKITTRPPPHPNTIKSSAAQYCTFLKTHFCTSLLQLLHCNTDLYINYLHFSALHRACSQ